MVHLQEIPKTFHVYRAQISVCTEVQCVIWKMFFPENVLHIARNRGGKSYPFDDKYDLDSAYSHFNIYKATFLFDLWMLWQPEVCYWIFMTTQVSQYILWDHKVSRFGVLLSKIYTLSAIFYTDPCVICTSCCHHHHGAIIWASTTLT